MAISRRIFIRSAIIVGLSGAAHSKLAPAAFGQKSGVKRISTPGFRVPEGSMSDPLTYYTKATFLAHLNGKFLLRMGNASWPVTLVRVVDFIPAKNSPTPLNGNGECFSLIFSGAKQLPQGTYTVEHGALGTFKLLLVPSSKGGGVYQLEAVINRLNS